MVVGMVAQPEIPVTMFVNEKAVGVRRSEMGGYKSVGLSRELPAAVQYTHRLHRRSLCMLLEEASI
jgi:hypothetical protein